MRNIFLVLVAGVFFSWAKFSQAQDFPKFIEGWWQEAGVYGVSAPRHGEIFIIFDDVRDKNAIKGGVFIKLRLCPPLAGGTEFDNGTFKGNVFEVSIPVSPTCAEEHPRYYIAGEPMYVKITIDKTRYGWSAKGTLKRKAPAGGEYLFNTEMESK